VIVNFKCKETEKIFNEIFSKKLPQSIQKVAIRKLFMLNSATEINQLRIPPNNRLEELKGKRKGQHSIRINGQWRICFKYDNSQACDVEIVDYH